MSSDASLPDAVTLRAIVGATPWRLLRLIVRRFPFRYATILALESGRTACAVFLPYALGRIIKSVLRVSPGTAGVLEGLAPSLALFAGLCVGEVLLSRVAAAIHLHLAPRQRHFVTKALFAHVQGHSHRFFTNTFSGSTSQKITEVAGNTTQLISTFVFDIWPIAVTIVAAVALSASTHAVLFAFLVVWSCAFVAASFGFARRAQGLAARSGARRSETSGHIVDATTNALTSRLYGRLEFERELLSSQLTRELRAVDEANRYGEGVKWFQFVSAAALKVGLLGAALLCWSRRTLDVGDLSMVVSLSFITVGESRNLSRRFVEFFDSLGVVESGLDVIAQPHEIEDPDDASSLRPSPTAIEFRHVHFGYGDGQRLFRDFSLTVPAGQRLGIVGASGSGKSTLLSLILRMYDVSGGAVRVSGVDVRSLKQNDLYRHVCLIPQDPSLFHRSVRDNIAYAKAGATESAVMDAARVSRAHGFISRSARAYETIVGERGMKLSGGERQRVAIARAVLRHSPIVLLDEATSSLDSITERAVQQALDETLRGKTLLVVAHRLSTVAKLDRIVVLSNGAIVEDGTHAELLAARGTYHRMWTQRGTTAETPSSGRFDAVGCAE